MIKENQRFLNFINVLLDIFLILIAVILSFGIRFYAMDGYVTEPFSSYLIIAAVDTPVQLYLFFLLRLYEPHRKRRILVELRYMTIGTALSFLLLFFTLYLVKSLDFSRLALIFYFIIKTALLGSKRVALRLSLRLLRRAGFNQKHAIFIGSNVMARNCYRELRRNLELGYQIHGYVSDSADWEEIPHLGKMEDLEQILLSQTLDEVFVSLDADEHKLIPRIIQLCNLNGIRFSFIPYYAMFMSENTQMDSLNGIPVMSLRKLPLDFIGNAFIKRCTDILGAAVLIVLTSPLMAAIAVGVRLSSPGPIIFRQERIGYSKKPFMMYKFRSMRINDSQDTGWTTDADRRKTKFGAFIRKYSLDEIPQFFNVLKGDMSLVGPRPEVPYFVEQFRDSIPLYLVRQQVRPGITGWAQVNGLRGNTSIEERVRYDMWYIKNWSVWLDIGILLRTLCGGFRNNELEADQRDKAGAEK